LVRLVHALGARGLGEVAMTGAVANAICNAAGRRVRDLPITLGRLIG